MSKHTPGPWVVGPEEGSPNGHIGVYRLLKAADGALIAHLWPHSDPNCEANAKLITSAPELLAACRMVRDLLATFPGGEHIRWDKVAADVRAAIAKAEGEVSQ